MRKLRNAEKEFAELSDEIMT